MADTTFWPRHPLAGKTVKLKDGIPPFINGEAAGAKFTVEDWAVNVLGQSVWSANGNPAAMEYAIRSVTLPIDNDVIYGKVGGFGHFVHDSEIVRESPDLEQTT